MNAATIIDASRAASASWTKEPLRRRRKVFARLAYALAAHQDDLVTAIVRDTGKPALDALGGDVLVTLEQMRFYYHYAHKILAPRRVSRDWFLFRSTRFTESFEPHGTVLIYGAANYPLQLGMIPAITALYAGNAVVLKLSEQSTALARLLERLTAQAKLPKHLLQIVCDPPATAGDYIDARPDFICFTGSSVNGTYIAERAARFLIPALLELGGKDAALVFDDCQPERTVEGVLYGAFANSGQVCVGIKRLYIEQGLYPEFVRRLVERTAQLRIGSDDAAPRDLAPIRSERLLTRLSAQISDAISRGAEVLTPSGDLSGAAPLILGNVPHDAHILSEESFGPVLAVAPFKDEAEAVQLANDSSFALGASLWTQDLVKAGRIASQLRAANISVNDVIRNIANPAGSFGGNQSSGHGRYHGPAGLFAFSRTKTIMTTKSNSPHQRNWFPFTVSNHRQLRKFIDLRHRTFVRFSRFMLIPFVLVTAVTMQAQQPGHLHIRVDIPPAQHGELAYLIFASQTGFPQNSSQSVRHGFLPDASMGDIDLGQLPKGRYAVSLYLDINGNHKLDAGWLGIPKEPVGVSRNPRVRMGAPRFDDGAFDMPDTDLTLEIHLVKP